MTLLQDFPWIQNILWIERFLYLSHGVDGRRPNVLFKIWAFQGTDTVFAGDGSAERDGCGEYLGGGLLHSLPLLFVAPIKQDIGMEIAVAGVPKNGNR